MGDAILGKTLEQISSLADRFHQMMSATDGDDLDPELGDLSALQGVRKFPVRIKCAGLPWATLEQALSSANGG
jgi:nitrogen fixation NifU-like protein